MTALLLALAAGRFLLAADGPPPPAGKPPPLRSKAPVTVQCHVRYVFDGDTFEADCHDPVTDLIVRRRIRLDAVDAPELEHPASRDREARPGQPFGGEARTFTEGLILDRRVEVTIVKTDRYDRQIGRVTLPATGSSKKHKTAEKGPDLGAALVAAGLAWRYRWFCELDDPACAELDRLEQAARAQKRGLWSEPGPVEPCRFRGSCK